MHFVVILHAMVMLLTKIKVISCGVGENQGNGFIWRRPIVILTDESYIKSSVLSRNYTIQDKSYHPAAAISSEKTESKQVKYKFEPLSPNEFRYGISNLLSPEIFSQKDPFEFLITEMNTPNKRIAWKWVKSYLNYFLVKNKFPPHYTPYAKTVQSLLRIENEFDDLRKNIMKIQRFFQNGFPTLPDDFLNDPELCAMFSTYVFSDPNPPFRILDVILNTTGKENVDMLMELMNLSRDLSLPQQYVLYVEAVVSFIQNGYDLQNLRTSVSEMRRFAAALDENSNNSQKK